KRAPPCASLLRGPTSRPRRRRQRWRWLTASSPSSGASPSASTRFRCSANSRLKCSWPKRPPLSLGLRPIFDDQVLEAFEMADVGGYEDQVVGTGDCGDLAVDVRLGFAEDFLA